MNTTKYYDKVKKLPTEELEKKHKRLYKARMVNKAMPCVIASSAFVAGCLIVGQFIYFCAGNPMNTKNIAEYNDFYKNQQIFAENPEISKEEYEEKFENMQNFSKDEIAEKMLSEEELKEYENYMKNTKNISRPSIFGALGVAGAAAATMFATENSSSKGFYVYEAIKERQKKKEEELEK